MEVPKVYIATDSEGQNICAVTAQDANSLINPSKVQEAIDNVKNKAEEEIKNIINAITYIKLDAEDAIIVEGTKMTQTIDDICKELKQVPNTILESISSIYGESVKAHDELQIKANEEAYSTANATASGAGGQVIEG